VARSRRDDAWPFASRLVPVDEIDLLADLRPAAAAAPAGGGQFLAVYRELTHRWNQGENGEAALPSAYLLITGTRKA
jgi:hypothetical protein